MTVIINIFKIPLRFAVLAYYILKFVAIILGSTGLLLLGTLIEDTKIEPTFLSTLARRLNIVDKTILDIVTAWKKLFNLRIGIKDDCYTIGTGYYSNLVYTYKGCAIARYDNAGSLSKLSDIQQRREIVDNLLESGKVLKFTQQEHSVSLKNGKVIAGQNFILDKSNNIDTTELEQFIGLFAGNQDFYNEVYKYIGVIPLADSGVDYLNIVLNGQVYLGFVNKNYSTKRFSSSFNTGIVQAVVFNQDRTRVTDCATLSKLASKINLMYNITLDFEKLLE